MGELLIWHTRVLGRTWNDEIPPSPSSWCSAWHEIIDQCTSQNNILLGCIQYRFYTRVLIIRGNAVLSLLLSFWTYPLTYYLYWSNCRWQLQFISCLRFQFLNFKFTYYKSTKCKHHFLLIFYYKIGKYSIIWHKLRTYS